MTTRINLLPPEIRRKDKAEKIMIYIVIGLLLLAGLLAGVKVLRDLQIKEREAHLGELRNETLDINRGIASLKAYDERKKQLEGVQGILDTALAGSTTWSKIMRGVSETTPNDVVLKQLTANEEGVSFKADVLLTGGKESGQKPVAKWLERLTGSGVFKSAWLVSSSYDEEKKRLDVDVMARFEPKAASSKLPNVPQVKSSPTQ